MKLYREYIFGNQCIAKLGYYKRLEAFVVLVAVCRVFALRIQENGERIAINSATMSFCFLIYVSASLFYWFSLL